jgi:TRAP-type C4-dicarboxylate transport system permease small subunit
VSDQTTAYGLVDRLRMAQLRLAATALVVMMCATVVDVSLRYAFNRPIRGSYELVEITLLIFVFHGMPTAFLQRRNIVIDLIDSFAGERVVAALIRFADGLSVIVLLLFGWAMLGPAMQAYDYGDRKLELNLPVYLLWIVALAGMAGTILCALAALLTTRPSPDERSPEAMAHGSKPTGRSE